MPNCKNCGGPLTKGNIKVVRKKGKRPFRIHRRCPQARGGTAGNPLQRPQDSTGGPIVVEGVFQYPTPPKYRYFITRAATEKLQRAIKGGQVGITVEVIPVPEWFLEADSEAFTDYVEITVDGL